MLLDLTDSTGIMLGQFMKASEREETGARLLNVAVSRARDHTVLVASFDYLRSKARKEGFTCQLLRHFKTHGQPLDAEKLLALGPEDWTAGLHHLHVGQVSVPADGAGVFTEGTFYPAFAQDLVAVRESLVIFSPFLTERGSSRWVEHLRAAIARGVAVRVVTRPPGDHGDILEVGLDDTISALRQVGVVVDLRAWMHEKIAVVDGEVLWHGSLNILSQRDTSESMLRIPSRSACEQVTRFVSTPFGGKDSTGKWGETENPACPSCGAPTIWKDGRFGIYFECEKECGGKMNARDARRQLPSGVTHGARQRAGQTCPAPGCRGTLRQRKGRRGTFLGCSDYPKCGHTEDA